MLPYDTYDLDQRSFSPPQYHPPRRHYVTYKPPRDEYRGGIRRPPGAPQVEPTNVLGVFGLSIRTRERDLEDEFGRYGDVEKVVVVYDQRVSPIVIY
jgi:hypothetical protein